MHDRTSHKSKPAAINTFPNWKQKFEPPIPVQSGAPLFSLQQARDFISALPATEQQAPRWRTAAELLRMVAETGADLMPTARLAVVRALHRREADSVPQRKRTKVRFIG